MRSSGGSWGSMPSRAGGAGWGVKPGGWAATLPPAPSELGRPAPSRAPAASMAWHAPPLSLPQHSDSFPGLPEPMGVPAAHEQAGACDASPVRAGSNSPPAPRPSLRGQQQLQAASTGRQLPTGGPPFCGAGCFACEARLSACLTLTLKPWVMRSSDTTFLPVFTIAVLPPDLQAVQPAASCLIMHSMPALAPAYSGGGVRQGEEALAGGGWRGANAAVEPTAAQLMQFAQAHGLQSAPMGAVMSAWHEACRRGPASVDPSSLERRPSAQSAAYEQEPQQQDQKPDLRQAQQLRAAAPPKLCQAVLAGAGRYVVPPPEPSAWQRAPTPLHQLNSQPRKPAQKPQQQRRRSSAAAAAAAADGEQAGGKDPRGRDTTTEAAAATAVGEASEASDFEDGLNSRERLPPAKRQKRRPSAASGAAEGGRRSGALPGGRALPARELLEVGPWLGVVDATSPQGYPAFEAEMRDAPSCRHVSWLRPMLLLLLPLACLR